MYCSNRTIPRSIIIGSLTVIVVYLLTNVSYLTVMTKAEMLNAEAVAVVFGERALGNFHLIIPIGVMVSTLGSTNNHIFGFTRAVYVAAKDGNLPEVLSYIQIQQLTPLSALIVTAMISLVLLTQADVQMFINYIEFLNSFYTICIYIAFLRFRFQLFKDIHRPIKLPIVVPIMMLLMNLYMFVAPLAINPSLDYVYVALAVFGGSAILYIVFIYFKLSPPFFDNFVTFYQLITQACPPTK
ncbi:b(0,+)-type amino acid transporter 1 [Bulinus truncatus]|nr:b(0,+)-type amino acid transporter 1 [Bulinus truncatus]